MSSMAECRRSGSLVSTPRREKKCASALGLRIILSGPKFLAPSVCLRAPSQVVHQAPPLAEYSHLGRTPAAMLTDRPPTNQVPLRSSARATGSVLMNCHRMNGCVRLRRRSKQPCSPSSARPSGQAGLRHHAACGPSRPKLRRWEGHAPARKRAAQPGRTSENWLSVHVRKENRGSSLISLSTL